MASNALFKVARHEPARMGLVLGVARRPLLGSPLLVGPLVVVLAGLLGGCGTFAGPTEERMSFAQMQTLNAGVSGDWVLYEHPYAREIVRDPDSRALRRLSYWVDDPRGDSRPLVLHFDDRGVLSRKQYGGPYVRPPQPDENEFQIGG